MKTVGQDLSKIFNHFFTDQKASKEENGPKKCIKIFEILFNFCVNFLL